MDYKQLEEQRQRNSLRAITDLIVFVAMVAVAGLCGWWIVKVATGSDWWAQLIGYVVAGVMWLLLSLCWISDREDRSMGAK